MGKHDQMMEVSCWIARYHPVIRACHPSCDGVTGRGVICTDGERAAQGVIITKTVDHPPDGQALLFHHTVPSLWI